MNKQEFLAALRKALNGLPKDDLEERLSFYGEMIDDRMEEGLSEEEAVAAVGTIEDIVSQVMADTPFIRLAKERITPKRRLKAWEIVLIILGSPIWLSLGIAAFAVILSLYIVIWAVIGSLWAVFASLIGCAIGGIAAGVVFAFTDNALAGAAVLGAGLVCAGLSVFAFYGCKASTKGVGILTKIIAVKTKNSLRRAHHE